MLQLLTIFNELDSCTFMHNYNHIHVHTCTCTLGGRGFRDGVFLCTFLMVTATYPMTLS